MEILDEFDIKIIKELERWSNDAYSAIATNLKYRIPWCINASIDYSNKVL
jgi:DNA-binding Lrp family transcriptional regulator